MEIRLQPEPRWLECEVNPSGPHHQPLCRERATTGIGRQPYISVPGVVSTSPVSSQVFRPDRIIGQPAYS